MVCFCLPRFVLFHPGFTAIVDKQLSAKYEILVTRAPKIIKGFPWGSDFEVDQFVKPDFESRSCLTNLPGLMSVPIDCVAGHLLCCWR